MFSVAAVNSLVHVFFPLFSTSATSIPPGLALEIHPNGMTVSELR